MSGVPRLSRRPTIDPLNNWRQGDAVRYFCSWSGGKDACLALHRAMNLWGPPVCLLNMLTEDREHSRSHGLPVRVLQEQATAIGVPIILGSASWADYEAEFIRLLKPLAQQGVQAGVFGDLDLQEHWDWEQSVCAQAGLVALEPLWQTPHETLVTELLEAGFDALIVTVQLDKVPESFLGRRYSEALADLRSIGVDVSGEGGEFHTCVIEGPIFSAPISYTIENIRRMQNHATLVLT
jgi:uncharacterized protein (TIGR00290 family)